jgi:hypothetical protein
VQRTVLRVFVDDFSSGTAEGWEFESRCGWSWAAGMSS